MPAGPGFYLVGQLNQAGFEGLAAAALEVPALVAAGKKRTALAQKSGVDGNDQLIDQPGLQQQM